MSGERLSAEGQWKKLANYLGSSTVLFQNSKVLLPQIIFGVQGFQKVSAISNRPISLWIFPPRTPYRRTASCRTLPHRHNKFCYHYLAISVCHQFIGSPNFNSRHNCSYSELKRCTDTLILKRIYGAVCCDGRHTRGIKMSQEQGIRFDCLSLIGLNFLRQETYDIYLPSSRMQANSEAHHAHCHIEVLKRDQRPGSLVSIPFLYQHSFRSQEVAEVVPILRAIEWLCHSVLRRMQLAPRQPLQRIRNIDQGTPF